MLGLLDRIRSKRVYRLFCKKSGRWELVDELEEKISWINARDMYELEEECEAAQLREYMLMPDGSERYVKAHWTKNIKKKQLTLEDYALGTLSMIQQITSICEMVNGMMGKKEPLDKMLELLMNSVAQRQMQTMQAGLQVVEKTQPMEAPPEALEAVEEEAEAMSEAKPCPRCMEEARKYFQGGGQQ